MKKLLFCLGLCISLNLGGQTASLNTTVQLNAIPNGDGTITLVWPALSFQGSYRIYKNTSSNPLDFVTLVAFLDSSKTSWKDASFTTGSKAEYAVLRTDVNGNGVAVGYLMAGNKTTETPSHGGIILVIDSNYIKPLSAELATLKNDLTMGGWIINEVYAGRNEKPTAIKNKIKTTWQNANIKPDYLYLLGHIPVPYSGYFSGNTDRCAYPPDGHTETQGNHTGAWPADVYYGDLEGIWSDNSVTCTTGFQTRHHNVPGDGKFDQCAAPSPVGLQMGRTDFANMSFFNPNDTALMKKYLDKVHSWRQDQIPYVERGLVDDNFTGYTIAATAYSIMSSCLSLDSVFSNRDYFTYQNKENYLWSYGCGAGSYTNCSGIGGNNNFNPGVFSNIFTSLAGSYFGDWDANDCFLKAPLCSGSLLSFWGGIPMWYAHYFGLGRPMGYSTMVTQNATTASFNGSQNKVHIQLLGDPTLTLKSVPPAGKLVITSSSGNIKLSWQSAKGKFDGYCVYKIDTTNNTWTRLNTPVITDTFYTDLSTWATGKYKYAVRTIRLEKTGSGSYYNLGGGGINWINHTNKLGNIKPLVANVMPNPSSGQFYVNLSEAMNTETAVSVTDLSGREIANPHWIKIGIHEMSLDLGSVSDGIYLLRITSGGASATAKIQVQH